MYLDLICFAYASIFSSISSFIILSLSIFVILIHFSENFFFCLFYQFFNISFGIIDDLFVKLAISISSSISIFSRFSFAVLFRVFSSFSFSISVFSILFFLFLVILVFLFLLLFLLGLTFLNAEEKKRFFFCNDLLIL